MVSTGLKVVESANEALLYRLIREERRESLRTRSCCRFTSCWSGVKECAGLEAEDFALIDDIVSPSPICPIMLKLSPSMGSSKCW